MVLCVCILLLTSFHSPGKKKDLWQDWNAIQQLMQQERKPILIDIYANWCIYCKKMDAKTYRNDSVYSYMKEHFYRFKFNGESKDTLVWRDKKFGFDQQYKVHQFVEYVTQGAVVFPTTVVIPPDGQPFALGGELSVKEMEMLLKYFNGAYPKQSFQRFSKEFTTEIT